MTVAAVILAATPESALAEVEGRPAVRRMVDAAWAGGGVPIVVVAPEQDGLVASSLRGSAAVHALPAPPEGGPVAQIVRGLAVAAREVADTEGALIWPARLVWVDPETITSLIEAHGADGASILRPTYGGRAGWPVLLPIDRLDALRGLSPMRLPDELVEDLAASGVPIREIDLGDPGTVYDRSTALDDLPPFEGPSEPTGGRPEEWGASVAADPDEGPLAGPALAPYEQAEAEERGGPDL